jgi:hypothetical protein
VQINIFDSGVTWLVLLVSVFSLWTAFRIQGSQRILFLCLSGASLLGGLARIAANATLSAILAAVSVVTALTAVVIALRNMSEKPGTSEKHDQSISLKEAIRQKRNESGNEADDHPWGR